MSVHSVVVSPSKAHLVGASTKELRVVVVAAGKVRVRMPWPPKPPREAGAAGGDGEDEDEDLDFDVNAHGVVVVHPGRSGSRGGCGLQNRWAVDAALTIVSVPVGPRLRS